MSPQMDATVCCIVGCSRPACDEVLYPDEALCSEHLAATPPALLIRLRTVARRRERLDRYWNDPALYEQAVASDRYFKLCDATGAVMDQLDAAWVRAKLSLVMSEANRSTRAAEDAKPQSSAIAS